MMKKIKVPLKKTYLSGKGLIRGLERMNKSIFPKGITLEKIIKNKLKNGKIRLLEIGCGEGTVLKELKQKFGANIELWGSNLLKSHGNLNMKGINIRIDDITHSKFKSSYFDVIVSQVTFPHIIRKDKALEETYRILKPNGAAFIEFDQKFNKNYFKEAEKMPEFFQILNKNLGNETISRFIIYKNGGLYSFFKLIKDLNKKGYKIRILKKTSEKTGTDYFCNLQMIKTLPKLKFPLSYNLEESQKLAQIPLGYGYVDVYNLKQ